MDHAGLIRELATNSHGQPEIVTLSLQVQNCLLRANTPVVERTIERENVWERLSAADRWALTLMFHGHINPYGQFESNLAAGGGRLILSQTHPMQITGKIVRLMRAERAMNDCIASCSSVLCVITPQIGFPITRKRHE